MLSACSHANLLDEGCHCFGAMEQDHKAGPNVDHYNYMIDLTCQLSHGIFMGWVGLKLCALEAILTILATMPCWKCGFLDNLRALLA